MDPTTPQPSQPLRPLSESPQPPQPLQSVQSLQPKANNPLKNYNTEAYVPERGGTETDTSISGNSGVARGSGNVAVGGASMADLGTSASGHSGNVANLSTTVTGNAFQTHGEALQDQLQPQVGSDGGLNQKPLETSENGLRTQNGQKPLEKHKKRGRIIAIVAILATALILGIAVAVVWWMVNGMTNKPNDVPTGGSGNITEEVGNGELVELALDDELVQEVYGRFKYFSGINGFGFRAFFNGINDPVTRNYTMTNQAIFNLDPLTECQQKYSEYNMEECYGLAEVKAKMLEMFGTDVIEDDAGIGMVFGTCGDYTIFSEEMQEFVVPIGCGGTGPAGLDRWLYKAELLDNRLYIYELALTSDVMYTETGDFVGRIYCDTLDGCDESNAVDLGLGENEVLVNRGYTEADIPEGYVAVEVVNYADKMMQFKWAFVKNDDGNYVFESLEKVEE